MNVSKHSSIVAVVAVYVLAAASSKWDLHGAEKLPDASEAGFGRYAVILDRRPFGVVQASSTNGPFGSGAIAPPDSFIKDLRMCAVTESDEGELRVGIVDVKQNKGYLFRVGETIDGITLVDADFQDGIALLRKGNEEYPVSMKGDAGQPDRASGDASVSPLAGRTSIATFRGRESYADRLRRRRDMMQERAVEAPRLSGEQLEQHLKQYQMDLIRAGGEKGPPLPIPLTPEMDAQLVSEGVLPPAQ